MHPWSTVGSAGFNASMEHSWVSRFHTVRYQQLNYERLVTRRPLTILDGMHHTG
jgi:hypothetical protein